MAANQATTVAGTGDAVPSIVVQLIDLVEAAFWPLLALAALLILRKQLALALSIFMERLRSGASLRMGAFEVGALDVGRVDLSRPQNEARVDDGERSAERNEYYRACRHVLLVHRLARSKTEGQEFDILVYLIPHEDDGTLAGVQKVEYFLGDYWKRVIFTSTSRFVGFPFRLAAYGPTLCTAKVHFTDGESVILHRYLDFEMGATAPFLNENE